MFMGRVHTRSLKFLAFALLLFYGVACGRSLVPELCNTLSALSNERAVPVLTTATCCRVPGEATGQPCALCSLVASLAEPVTYVVYEVAFERCDTRVAQEALGYLAQPTWEPASLRGPPLIA